VYYFKFLIPTNADGSRVFYSLGYHGTMSHCPKNVDVLVYDDDTSEGIATTDDTFIPPEVEELSLSQATEILKEKKDKDDRDKADKKINGIYFKDTEKWEKKWLSEVLNG